MRRLSISCSSHSFIRRNLNHINQRTSRYNKKYEDSKLNVDIDKIVPLNASMSINIDLISSPFANYMQNQYRYHNIDHQKLI